MSEQDLDGRRDALSVGQAAARLGVAASTLRSWQHRYGLAPTARSSGGHRRYLPADVAALEYMHRLVLAGVSPSRAAELAIEYARAPLDIEPPAPPRPSPLPLPLPTEPAASTVEPPRRAPGGPGGRVLPVPGASPAARGLARAATRLDGDSCVQLVAASLAELGVQACWDQVLRPVLVAAGGRWARTGEGVEIEHLLTESVVEALRGYRQSCPRHDGRPPTLLACAPADQHSLPLYVLAAALAERGLPSQVLGSHVPPAALSAALSRLRARAIFVWAQLPDPRNLTALRELPVLRPRPMVVAGGPGWQGNLPAEVVVAGSLGHAAELLASGRATQD